MNFEFKTSSRGHRGTISPAASSGASEVLSASEARAGKWVCRIEGPAGFVKTVRCAPYVGAARAAIARALRISVAEVEVTEKPSSGGKGTPIVDRWGGCGDIHTTPQTKGECEFNSDDEEFAAFDLNAAVSSAKKPFGHQASPFCSDGKPSNAQNGVAVCKNGKSEEGTSFNSTASRPIPNGLKRPPLHPRQGHKSASMIASAEYIKCRNRNESEGIEGLRLEKERLEKEIALMKQKISESKMAGGENSVEPGVFGEGKQELNVLKDQASALRKELKQLVSGVKRKEDQRKGLKDEIQRAMEENDRLKEEGRSILRQRDTAKGQIRAVQEEQKRVMDDLGVMKVHKEKLETEGLDIVRKNTLLKQETAQATQQRDKTKGQLRAVQEEHTRLAVSLNSLREEKEKLEKEVRTTREERDMHKKEAIAAKQALKSHRAQLDSVARGKDTKCNPLKEEKVSAASSEPPTKKQKAGKQGKDGVVVKSMKVADLKEEAVARGMDVKEVSRINKGELLNTLVIGSTCITKTSAWEEVIRLRDKFQNERRQAKEEENRRLQAEYEKEARKERERQAQTKAIREEQRKSEIASQIEKHQHHFAKVHSCNLAKTEDLLLHGQPRRFSARCDECRNHLAFYTCESCDFDICEECFQEKTMTVKQKRAEAKKKAALEKQRQEEAAKWCRQMEEEENKQRKKWDPKTQFKSKIVDPPDKHFDPEGSKKKGYTVWTSDGYGYDGWHSYDGPPMKEFDATFATKAEANERARYVFYWKNPWGMEPQRIMEGEEVDESRREGMVTYVVTPPDSTTWTVSVVPDAAFAYIENAHVARGKHGDDLGPTASDFGYGLAF